MRKIRKLLSLELNSSLILRKKSIKIDLEKIDKKYFELVQNMIFTMVSDKGIGLAAPQIGKNIRLVIILTYLKLYLLTTPQSAHDPPGNTARSYPEHTRNTHGRL